MASLSCSANDPFITLVCLCLSIISNPAPNAASYSALESWQSPPATVGTIQPSRISRPITKPRLLKGAPTCFQKLNILPAFTSSPFSFWAAILKFSIFPAVNIQLLSLSSAFHSSLCEDEIMGLSLSLFSFLNAGICATVAFARERFITKRATFILKPVSDIKLCF